MRIPHPILSAASFLRESLWAAQASTFHMVPHKQTEQPEAWQSPTNLHFKLLTGLLFTMRQQLTADSSLASCVDDYALLLQLLNNAKLPKATVFDLPRVLDEAVLTAKKLYPPGDNVLLTVSLQSGMEKQWLGYPAHLQALLRNLLHIGLWRTSAGLVCMRLEILSAQKPSDQAWLQIQMEDSGPPLQPGQWQQMFEEELDELSDFGPPDIAWLLAIKLFNKMNGSFNVSNIAQGGMMLQGRIALCSAQLNEPASELSSDAGPEGKHVSPPLVLIVEDHITSRNELAAIFTQAGCRVFMVENHGQALCWAPVLPFSAIVLNNGLLNGSIAPARRLRTLQLEELMPDIPLWTLMAQECFVNCERWNQAGITEILFKPVKLQVLIQLRREMPVRDKSFYRALDREVVKAFSESITARLPWLRESVMGQLDSVCEIALEYAECKRGQAHINTVMHKIHAAKSAALTLGYFRIAAFMAAIELAISRKELFQVPGNWAIIADCIQNANIE